MKRGWMLSLAVGYFCLLSFSHAQTISSATTSTLSQSPSNLLPLSADVRSRLGSASVQHGVGNLPQVTVQGEIRQQGALGVTSGTFTAKLSGRDKSRMEVWLGSDDSWQIRSGRSVSRYARGKITNLPLHASLNPHSDLIPGLSDLTELANSHFNVLYVGQEAIGSVVVDHIRVEPANAPTDPKLQFFRDLAAADLYIAVDSHLLLKRTHTVASVPNAKITFPVSESYDDYRTVNGISIPFHITAYFRGQKAAEFFVTAVDLTSPISDSEFEVRQ